MGVKVGRIVKEFVFKSLVEQRIEVKIHSRQKELGGVVAEVRPQTLVVEVLEGEPKQLAPEEKVQVYFFFQNNYHTFEAAVAASEGHSLVLSHPEGVYKNPQRKYERVRLEDTAEVVFTLRGTTVELDFPKSSRPGTLPELGPAIGEQPDSASIQSLHGTFKKKTESRVSEARIVMFRNRNPERYEERVIAETGKMLWIPSTEEDFLVKDPFPDERIVTRRDLVRYEESLDQTGYIITSKLGNILYEKQKKGIHSQLYCPVLYGIYIVGYIYLCNRDERKEKIPRELAEYCWEFAKILAFALEQSGYFAAAGGEEQRYEGKIIDLSPSGLLFAHPRTSLADDLHLQTDLDITLRLPGRRMEIGTRVRRKFKDEQRAYFGLQFLRIEPSDVGYLFEKLYGRPYTSEEDERWEGGTPPPPLDLFAEGEG